MKKRKRLVSLLLAITMLFSMLPVSALAVDEVEVAETVTEVGYYETEPTDEGEQSTIEEDNQEGTEEATEEVAPTEEYAADVTEAEDVALPELPEAEVEGESVTEQAMGAVAVSGSCGENVTWTLDEDGTLTINGSGNMTDYDFSNKFYTPWYNSLEEIKTVVIQDGHPRIFRVSVLRQTSRMVQFTAQLAG